MAMREDIGEAQFVPRPSVPDAVGPDTTTAGRVAAAGEVAREGRRHYQMGAFRRSLRGLSEDALSGGEGGDGTSEYNLRDPILSDAHGELARHRAAMEQGVISAAEAQSRMEAKLMEYSHRYPGLARDFEMIYQQETAGEFSDLHAQQAQTFERMEEIKENMHEYYWDLSLDAGISPHLMYYDPERWEAAVYAAEREDLDFRRLSMLHDHDKLNYERNKLLAVRNFDRIQRAMHGKFTAGLWGPAVEDPETGEIRHSISSAVFGDALMALDWETINSKLQDDEVQRMLEHEAEEYLADYETAMRAEWGPYIEETRMQNALDLKRQAVDKFLDIVTGDRPIERLQNMQDLQHELYKREISSGEIYGKTLAYADLMGPELLMALGPQQEFGRVADYKWEDAVGHLLRLSRSNEGNNNARYLDPDNQEQSHTVSQMTTSMADEFMNREGRGVDYGQDDIVRLDHALVGLANSFAEGGADFNNDIHADIMEMVSHPNYIDMVDTLPNGEQINDRLQRGLSTYIQRGGQHIGESLTDTFDGSGNRNWSLPTSAQRQGIKSPTNEQLVDIAITDNGKLRFTPRDLSANATPYEGQNRRLRTHPNSHTWWQWEGEDGETYIGKGNDAQRLADEMNRNIAKKVNNMAIAWAHSDGHTDYARAIREMFHHDMMPLPLGTSAELFGE